MKKVSKATSIILALMLILTNLTAVFAEDMPDLVSEPEVQEESAEEVQEEKAEDVQEEKKEEPSAPTKEASEENADKPMPKDEESAKPAKKEPEKTEKDDEIKDVAFSESEEIDDTVITVEAEKGVFPEGCTLSVQKITKKSELKDIDDAVSEKRSEESNVVESFTYDISVLDKDGNEIQPDGDVNVSFKSDLVENENLDTSVYHITETTAEALDGETDDDVYTAVTDGFSRYVVEFTYNNLTYVMEGDTEIPLSDVLDYVGLTGEVSDAEGSNDELFSFDEREGVWYVIAHEPFDTKEWMKVTIDGIVYEVVVTDATYYGAWKINFDANGGTYSGTTPVYVIATNTSTSGRKAVHLKLSSYVNNFTRSGYILIGFDTSSTATTPTYLPTETVRKNITCKYGTANTAKASPYATDTFYAIWEDIDNVSGTYRDVDWAITEDFELIIGKEGETQTFSYAESETSSNWPWDRYSYAIKSVSFVGTVNGTGSMQGMFFNYPALTNIDASNFNTGNVTNMSAMFSECPALTDLDLSNFDTENVTNMRYMFSKCPALTDLDLSNFDTENVTDMYAMFSECPTLTDLDVSNFNTSNVTDMSFMFSECSALTDLNVSNFNTGNVTNMYAMFSYCIALTRLDVSKFNTGNVTNMSYMFSNCNVLDYLDLSNFNTDNVMDMNHMFYNCWAITSLNLSSFDTSNVTEMTAMFEGCSALKRIYVATPTRGNTGSWNTDNATSSTDMFTDCTSLVGGQGTAYDASAPLDKTRAKIDGGASDPGYLTDIASTEMYAEFDSETGVLRIFRDISGTYTDEQVVDTKTYWTGIEDIEGETLPKWYETTAAAGVSEIRIEDTFSPKTAYGLFADMCALVDISGLNKLNTSNIENMDSMFYNCESLTSLDVSSFDTSNVTEMSFMFESCSSLTSLDVSGFDTSNVTNMSYMFEGCTGLTSLDVSSFDTSNVYNMRDMFEGCSALTRIFASNGWKTGNVTISNSMFTDCTNLVGGQGTTFDASAPIDKTRAKIDGGATDPGYLTYKAPSFTVTFNANGGTNAPDPQNKASGVQLILTTDTPTREGYEFVSWNTEADGSGSSYSPGGAYETDADVTLYAQWEESVPIPTGIKANHSLWIIMLIILMTVLWIYSRARRYQSEK